MRLGVWVALSALSALSVNIGLRVYRDLVDGILGQCTWCCTFRACFFWFLVFLVHAWSAPKLSSVPKFHASASSAAGHLVGGQARWLVSGGSVMKS